MNRRECYDEIFKKFDEHKEEITQGIEKNRKGKCRLTVVDKSGAPIQNAKISVNQTSHEFRFGANLFMLDELESDEKNQLYKDYFKNIFAKTKPLCRQLHNGFLLFILVLLHRFRLSESLHRDTSALH